MSTSSFDPSDRKSGRRLSAVGQTKPERLSAVGFRPSAIGKNETRAAVGCRLSAVGHRQERNPSGCRLSAVGKNETADLVGFGGLFVDLQSHHSGWEPVLAGDW